MRSKTFAYLMTDVAGSTALWEQDRASMAACVKALDWLVESVVTKFGGRLLKARGEGDSHFAVFPSPDGALSAISEIVTRLRTEPSMQKIQLRAAIHAGESDDRAGDFYGPTINRCARIRSVAHPGQVLVSEVAKLLSSPSKEFEFKALGEHRLRDIPRRERLFQLVVPGLEGEFPLTRSLSSGPHNLPEPLTTFVGRAEDLAKLSQVIGLNRMTTVVGAGGVGKTRLALRVATEVAGEYDGGVWFVELSQISNVESVVPLVCSTLSPGIATDEGVIALIGDQRVLLLLDNCEHLDQECKRLSMKLLGACPNLRIVATSRKHLAIPGEQVFQVRGLAIPADGLSKDGRRFDALQLLVERAGNRGVELSRDEDSLRQNVELCRKLDGLPLAIEIVAGTTNVLTIPEISNSIGEFLERESIDSGSKPYSPTIAATIEWSCNLLSAPARDLLTRLTVFPSSWTLEGAQQVCAYGEIEAGQTLDLVRELVSHSLVFAESVSADHRRFGMLQTTRQVLGRRSPVTNELREQFVGYFGELAKDARAAGESGHESLAYEQFNTEYEGLKQALEWSFELSPDRCLQLAENLYYYWLRGTHLRDGLTWYERLSGAALDEVGRVKALTGLSAFHIRLEEHESAQAALSKAEALAKSIGDSEWPRLLTNQAILWSKIGKLEEAKAGLERCATLYEELNSPLERAHALQNLGVVMRFLGNPLDDCGAMFHSALAIARSCGSASLQANAYSSLADIHKEKGEVKLAVEACRLSLKFYQEGPWLVQTAWTIVTVTELLEEIGEHKAAAQALHAAERLAELSGTSLSKRKSGILAGVRESLDRHLSQAEWRSAQRLVRTKNPAELVSLVLASLQGVPSN